MPIASKRQSGGSIRSLTFLKWRQKFSLQFPQAVLCLESVHAHLFEQPIHVGKKCRGGSFAAPGLCVANVN